MSSVHKKKSQLVLQDQRISQSDRPYDMMVGTEAITAMQEWTDETREDVTNMVMAALNIEFYGQPITARYRADCAAILSRKLHGLTIYDYSRVSPLIIDAIERHITYKLEIEPRWSYEDIVAINKFNKACNLWDLRKWEDEDSFRLSHIVAPAVALIGLAVFGIAARAAWKNISM